jgi:hypothetical protein
MDPVRYQRVREQARVRKQRQMERMKLRSALEPATSQYSFGFRRPAISVLDFHDFHAQARPRDAVVQQRGRTEDQNSAEDDRVLGDAQTQLLRQYSETGDAHVEGTHSTHTVRQRRSLIQYSGQQQPEQPVFPEHERR